MLVVARTLQTSGADVHSAVVTGVCDDQMIHGKTNCQLIPFARGIDLDVLHVPLLFPSGGGIGIQCVKSGTFGDFLLRFFADFSVGQSLVFEVAAGVDGAVFFKDHALSFFQREGIMLINSVVIDGAGALSCNFLSVHGELGGGCKADVNPALGGGNLRGDAAVGSLCTVAGQCAGIQAVNALNAGTGRHFHIRIQRLDDNLGGVHMQPVQRNNTAEGAAQAGAVFYLPYKGAGDQAVAHVKCFQKFGIPGRCTVDFLCRLRTDRLTVCGEHNIGDVREILPVRDLGGRVVEHAGDQRVIAGAFDALVFVGTDTHVSVTLAHIGFVLYEFRFVKAGAGEHPVALFAFAVIPDHNISPIVIDFSRNSIQESLKKVKSFFAKLRAERRRTENSEKTMHAQKNLL